MDASSASSDFGVTLRKTFRRILISDHSLRSCVDSFMVSMVELAFTHFAGSLLSLGEKNIARSLYVQTRFAVSCFISSLTSTAFASELGSFQSI